MQTQILQSMTQKCRIIQGGINRIAVIGSLLSTYLSPQWKHTLKILLPLNQPDIREEYSTDLYQV